MRAASTPAPFASTTGAAIAAGSYCSATANSVGFVTTTSAFGTVDFKRFFTSSPLHLPAARNDLRIALHVLHFFANFLRRHLQVLLVLPPLEAEIEQRKIASRAEAILNVVQKSVVKMKTANCGTLEGRQGEDVVDLSARSW